MAVGALVGEGVAVGEVVAVAVALASWTPVEPPMERPVKPLTAASALPPPARMRIKESVRRRRGCARKLERRVGAGSDGCGQWGASVDEVSSSGRSVSAACAITSGGWFPASIFPPSAFMKPHILCPFAPERNFPQWGARHLSDDVTDGALMSNASEAEAALFQADVTLLAKNDVVKQLDLQRLASAAQLLRGANILW